MKDQIKMIVFVVLLGIIASAILVGTDGFTKQIIADNEDYSLKSTILNAFEISYTEADLFDVYQSEITEKDINDATYYFSSDGSVGFEVEGKGLWGPIRGFLTLEDDLETIKGIQILYHEETPGLGGVVSEDWYLEKYKGKKMDKGIVIKNDANPNSDNEVDAITGATMTSNAFELLLNENYQLRKEVLE